MGGYGLSGSAAVFGRVGHSAGGDSFSLPAALPAQPTFAQTRLRERHAGRLGTGLLEVERLIRPAAENVRTSRRERKAGKHGGRGDPPPDSDASGGER